MSQPLPPAPASYFAGPLWCSSCGGSGAAWGGGGHASAFTSILPRAGRPPGGGGDMMEGGERGGLALPVWAAEFWGDGPPAANAASLVCCCCRPAWSAAAAEVAPCWRPWLGPRPSIAGLGPESLASCLALRPGMAEAPREWLRVLAAAISFAPCNHQRFSVGPANWQQGAGWMAVGLGSQRIREGGRLLSPLFTAAHLPLLVAAQCCEGGVV